MRERKECHCMLFITPDNEFAGDQQEIELELIEQVRDSMNP
jgi:ferredoxin-thioredoxin reductase catalytic chain